MPIASRSVAVALGAIALVLSACTPAPATPAAPAAQAPAQAPAAAPTPAPAQITRGGVLSWAYTTIPLKLDPVWTQARTDGIILSQIIQGLVLPNAQGTGVEPGLADTWTVSEDGLTYTFHLRAGAKFHNGKALTPEDVIASLERDRTMGTYKWSLENVQSIEKIDSSTVKITLTSKVASFLPRLAMNPNAIFPAEEITKVGSDEFTQPIGTGPFKFKEWVRGDHLTLERNADYWQMAPDGKPLPYLDGIEIRQVAEDSTKVLQIQAGSLNGTEGLPWSQVSALQSDTRGQLILLPQQQIYFMVLNLTRPPFDDVKVRQAMSLALDRQVFVDRATAGKADVANSFMPKSGVCWNSNSKLPYDLTQAKALIAQSKYPNGFSGAKLQLTSGGQVGRDNAILAKDMWDKIGITLTIEEVEGSSLSNNWYKNDFDSISGFQWTNGMVDPEQHVIFFFVDPKMNTGYQPSQHATDLAKAASQELDPQKRCQMYGELQDTYNQDVGGTITLYYTPSVNYLSPDVKGFTRTPLGVPLYKQTWLGK
jgi:peptide/nickel transport system substrate-binding protein